MRGHSGTGKRYFPCPHFPKGDAAKHSALCAWLASRSEHVGCSASSREGSGSSLGSPFPPLSVPQCQLPNSRLGMEVHCFLCFILLTSELFLLYFTWYFLCASGKRNHIPCWLSLQQMTKRHASIISFYEMRSCYVVQGGLKLLRVQAILLPQPLKPRLEDDQTG